MRSWFDVLRQHRSHHKIYEPPNITLIVHSARGCASRVGALLSSCRSAIMSLFSLPLSVKKSFKFPYLSSSTTSSLRAIHSSFQCPWSLWNSHHFLESLMLGGDFIFLATWPLITFSSWLWLLPRALHWGYTLATGATKHSSDLAVYRLNRYLVSRMDDVFNTK